MLEKLVIQGGAPLAGELEISGAKNAALPVLCATLLADGECNITNVPKLADVRSTGQLLRHLGVEVSIDGHSVRTQAANAEVVEAPYDLVRKMRASVLVLGPLLARHGRARVSLPGGCAIGERPIDQHLKGLEAMGASIELSGGYVNASVGRLVGARIVLDHGDHRVGTARRASPALEGRERTVGSFEDVADVGFGDPEAAGPG